MQSLPRHQCLIYQGAPSRHLTALATLVGQKLNNQYQCIYLNSPPMVAGMRSYLAATGIDVTHEVEKGSLILSSDLQHLVDGQFDVDRMMGTLADALSKALDAGYNGLWATGDMTWEFGSQKNLSKLLEYEWRLEEFFREHLAIGGICQYHADTLPHEIMREGLASHPSIFVSETLSRINPHYLRSESYDSQGTMNPALDSALNDLYRGEDAN
jgi:hypothetical protein